jgi:hypothetical protein
MIGLGTLVGGPGFCFFTTGGLGAAGGAFLLGRGTSITVSTTSSGTNEDSSTGELSTCYYWGASEAGLTASSLTTFLASFSGLSASG